MKTIGLLGGMSWESTAGYYRLINEGIKNVLGGLHSAQLILYSVDFAEIETRMQAGDWEGILQEMTKAAGALQAAGADFLLIGTNTIHKIAPQLEAAIDIPLIHIGDAVGEMLQSRKISQAALLGTAVTMEDDFYRGRLMRNFGMDVRIPDAVDRKRIDHIIFQELCLGKTTTDSKRTFLDVIDRLSAGGAQAVILGCTEIGMLINQTDTAIPLFDSMIIHAEKAVGEALKRSGDI